jgi:hypothetical protein
MTKKDLRQWVEKANCSTICGNTVAWVAAEGKHGREMALEWIESPKEYIAAAGWATLSSLVGIKDDADLDLAELKRLLQRVEKTIHERLCDLRRQLRAVAHRPRRADREEDRQGVGGHGRHGVQGPVRAGVHREGQKPRVHRQEEKDSEMLSQRRRFGLNTRQLGNVT